MCQCQCRTSSPELQPAKGNRIGALIGTRTLIKMVISKEPLQDEFPDYEILDEERTRFLKILEVESQKGLYFRDGLLCNEPVGLKERARRPATKASKASPRSLRRKSTELSKHLYSYDVVHR